MEADQDPEELIRHLDDKRDAYIDALKNAHAAFIATVLISDKTRDSLNHPAMLGGYDAENANYDEEADQQAVAGAGADEATTTKSRTDMLDPESFTCVAEMLEPQHFDEEEISHYLRTVDVRDRWKSPSNPFRLACDGQFIPRGDNDRDTASDYALWEVATNGLVKSFDHGARDIRERESSMAIWNALKTSPLTMPSIAGRIVHVSGLTPHLDAALRYTMHQIFPIDDICFSMERPHYQKATMHDAFDRDERLRRSFRFYFSYLALVDDGHHLSPEQASNRLVAKHIKRYVSSVSLCLTGDPVRKVGRMRSEGLEDGFVYDTFAPWHVLAIGRVPGATKNVCRDRVLECTTRLRVTCGPEAFMIKVLSEYERANFSLAYLIAVVCGPVTTGMDCGKILSSATGSSNLRQELMRYLVSRPELLDRFLTSDEDNQLMARRCFWTCTTLDAIKTNIQTLIRNYEQKFTTEIWEGRRETLWPLADHSSRRGLHYKAIMAFWRTKLEAEIVTLRELSASVDTKLKDITDQETRRSTLAASAAANAGTIAIQQGRNIRLLTTVSIFFLPLTYVTSIFGMTNMPNDQSYWMFGMVTAAICVPFFSLVLSLNNKKGFAFWERTVNALFKGMASLVGSARTPPAKQSAKKSENPMLVLVMKARNKDSAPSLKASAGMLQRWRRLFSPRTGKGE